MKTSNLAKHQKFSTFLMVVASLLLLYNIYHMSHGPTNKSFRLTAYCTMFVAFAYQAWIISQKKKG